MFVIFPGLVRQLRLVKKAGQLPSDWDAVPQWLLKTTSLCQGIIHHDKAQLLTWEEWDKNGHITYFNSDFGTIMSHIELALFVDTRWTWWVMHWSKFLSHKVSKHLSSFVFLPSNCSEGTCDGCSFHFLWQSQHACPLCTKNHYKEIVSACIQGIQVVLHNDKNNSPPLQHTPITATSQTHLCGKKYLEVLISAKLISTWLKLHTYLMDRHETNAQAETMAVATCPIIV